MISCIELSNETYRNLSNAERQKRSSDYISLSDFHMSGTEKHMKALEKAVRLDPKNEQAWKALAQPFLYRGLYEEWHERSSKVIELHPKAWQGWLGYQKLFFFRDYGGALYDLDATDTLTIDKTDFVQNKSVDYLRGLCYLGLHDYDKATEYFQLYLDKQNAATGSVDIDETAYLYLAIIANELQQYHKAIDYLAATPVDELLADHYYQQAYAYFMLGEIEPATVAIRRANEAYNSDNYHRTPFYEVIYQIYQTDLSDLEADIACFR